jgi:hypothetical protein
MPTAACGEMAGPALPNPCRDESRPTNKKSRQRERNPVTSVSNASLHSIIAQCPQFGNTCSSACGITRIGSSAMSSGLTRSSRPQVISVGAWIAARCATRCVAFGPRNSAASASAEGHRIGGGLQPRLDQLIGDDRLVEDHRAQPGLDVLARGLLGEGREQAQPLAGEGREQVHADAADGDEALHALRVIRGHEGTDDTAQRIAEDVRALDAEPVHQAQHRIDASRHRRALDRVAAAVAGQVDENAAKVPREHRQVALEIRPAAHAGPGAVDHQQHGAAAGLVVVDAALGGFQNAAGGVVAQIGHVLLSLFMRSCARHSMRWRRKK